jgi:cation:H+ antiporter
MVIDIVSIVAGLVILIVAADRLVVSAVRIAKVLNVSAVVIGAVIVGFGTSVPEFAVSAVAASEGNLPLAISNVVGSNIANLTLVLGVAGVIVLLTCAHSVIRREGLLMLASVSLLGLLLIDGSLSRIEGLLLFAAMIVSIVLLLRWSKGAEVSESDIPGIEVHQVRLGAEALYGVAALVATVIASQVLLAGVEGVGAELGLSVVFMGLITGVGTSLPELSAAVASARRGETDLILGNVLGSNTFNSLGVAGMAAIIGPGSTEILGLWLIGMMVVVALVAGLFAYTRQRISRIEAVLLLAAFVVYVVLST